MDIQDEELRCVKEQYLDDLMPSMGLRRRVVESKPLNSKLIYGLATCGTFVVAVGTARS